MSNPRIAVRWTIGDVSDAGFEALNLSVWGAYRIFGTAARYIICLNTLRISEALKRTGQLPRGVMWLGVTKDDIPSFILDRLDSRLAEGVAWKFGPLHVDPDAFEIALDNDCILWRMPDAMRDWLSSDNTALCLIAADVKACFGIFADICGADPRNSGIRGIPPHFDFADSLKAVLSTRTEQLTSELDEQGLQVAAVSTNGEPAVVPVDDVSICSPFPPHVCRLGHCGAHFVGLNSRQLPWMWEGRNASEYVREHWERLAPVVYAATVLDSPPQ